MKQLFLFAAIAAFALTSAAQTSTKPFTIYDKSIFIAKTEISVDPDSHGNSIQIEVNNVSGGSASISRGILPPAEINELDVLQGSFARRTIVGKDGRGQKVLLSDVNFPFRTRITISGEIFDIEVVKPGTWRIRLALNQ
jgi:hypothetical protein